jgi:hypothetical protein
MTAITNSQANFILQFLFDEGFEEESCRDWFNVWRRHREGRLSEGDRKLEDFRSIISNINIFIADNKKYMECNKIRNPANICWEPRYPQGSGKDHGYWLRMQHRKKYEMGPSNANDPIEVMDYDNVRMDSFNGTFGDSGCTTPSNSECAERMKHEEEKNIEVLDTDGVKGEDEDEKDKKNQNDNDDDEEEKCHCPSHTNIARFDAVRFVNQTCACIELRIPEEELTGNILENKPPFLFKLTPGEGEKDTNTFICVVRRLSNTMQSKKNPSTPIQDHIPLDPPPLVKRAPSSNHWDADDQPSEAATASEWEALTACSRTLF